MEIDTQSVEHKELQPPEERIAIGLTGWLAEEAAISSRENDRNSYLDDLITMRQKLSLPPDNPDNWSAQKVYSHHDRLPFWFEAFTLDPTNDAQSAKLLFAFLMRVAGTYKVQCYFQATDQDDFMRRKLEPNIYGADIRIVTNERLSKVNFGGVYNQQPMDIGALSDTMRAAIVQEKEDLPLLCERARLGQDFGLEDSPGAHLAAAAQTTWLKCAVDAIVYAASIRNGDLDEVPFLEPRSISDEPQIIHPLTIR